jgi:integral membrane sensor domain MASE1
MKNFLASILAVLAGIAAILVVGLVLLLLMLAVFGTEAQGKDIPHWVLYSTTGVMFAIASWVMMRTKNALKRRFSSGSFY